jgi:MFS family permease
MYPSIRPTPSTIPQPDSVESADAAEPFDHEPPRTRRGIPRVGRNVVFLGLTSMVTDVSSEMVNAVLPVFLVFQLRFSALEFGLFNGIYLGVAGLMNIAGGVIADRTARYKEVAGAGYAVSAGCKLGLLAARNAPFPASTALFADRIGKGVRAAPRDALISLSAPSRRLGEAFGVHRAFDTAGAVLGPVVAFLVLRAAPAAYDAVFVLSFLIALIGLGILVLFVENRRRKGTPGTPASLKAALRLLRQPEVRALAIVGGMLGFFTVADAFIYLMFERQADFDTAYFPLLYVGTALSYLMLAIPLGRLADRVGRSRVFVGGYVALLGVYTILLVPSSGRSELLTMLVLLGAFYACTDGVLVAMASTVVASDLRTSGIAILTTVAALSAFLASLLFGAAWTWWGPTTAVAWFTAGAALAVAVAGIVLRVGSRRYG